MSIVGIGVDLCEISRVDKSLQKHGERFAKKILHPQELETFNNHKLQARFLAKRFAAKEAFAKAMGTGIADGVSLKNIEVVNDSAGKPEIRLHAETADKLKLRGRMRVHLSISDERDMAVAQVVIESISGNI